jgi:hypothetical protein
MTTHGPIRHIVAWLAPMAMIAALAGGVLSAGTANASTQPVTTALTASHSTLASTTSSTTEDPWATSGTDSGVQTSGTDSGGNLDGAQSASTYCYTYTVHAWINDVFGIRLANYWMHTYFCYNYTKVTYHSTWENGSVTTTGSATGWSYDGVVESSFNCYYANSYACSGNHETSQGKFEACLLKIGCYSSWYPYIQEWEWYNGGARYSYSD